MNVFDPTFDVRISGLTLAADLREQVLSVSHESSLDNADMFEVVFSNPDNRFTDSPLFNPGQNVEIHMGYGNDLKPMMLGEITSIDSRFPQSGAQTIAVSGYDKSFRLRHGEPIPRDFKYMNDSMIVAQIAAENLLIPVVDPSPWFHVQKTQSGSDFAFIKDLAAQNFFDAYVRWDKLYFQFPRPTDVKILEWGKNLVSFSPRLSTAGLAGLQVIRGYNEALAQAVVGVATGALVNLDDVVERLGPETLQMVASLGRRVAHKQRITNPIDAMAFATAMLQNLVDGLYEGVGRCVGMPDLHAGDYIKVLGVGKRFSGRYRVRKVSHRMGNGFMTEFEMTQRGGAALLSLIRKTTDEEAAPPPDRPQKFYGVAVAKVTKAPSIAPEPDPAALLGGRVKVSLPWLSDEHESTWARVMTPSASGGSGMYFMPDEGDNVIVAFQDGDLSMPVVLGSVWDGPARPPVYPPSQGNTMRMIKSKAGHVVTLDDMPGQGKITVKSTGGHIIALDDTAGSQAVRIEHLSGSTIELNSDGSISFTAKSDLVFAATNDITFKANKKISLDAGSDISLEAANVAVEVSGSMNIGDRTP
jgi:phage protein D/phage baseplate assembly protein gpV